MHIETRRREHPELQCLAALFIALAFLFSEARVALILTFFVLPVAVGIWLASRTEQ